MVFLAINGQRKVLSRPVISKSLQKANRGRRNWTMQWEKIGV